MFAAKQSNQQVQIIFVILKTILHTKMVFEMSNQTVTTLWICLTTFEICLNKIKTWRTGPAKWKVISSPDRCMYTFVKMQSNQAKVKLYPKNIWIWHYFTTQLSMIEQTVWQNMQDPINVQKSIILTKIHCVASE